MTRDLLGGALVLTEIRNVADLELAKSNAGDLVGLDDLVEIITV